VRLVDVKRVAIVLGILVALVTGYFVIKTVLMDQLLFAQKQLADPSEFAKTPAAAPPPVRPAPSSQPAARKEFAVWFRVSGASPEAKVTYTDGSGEKGGVVVKLPWQVASVAREGDHLVLAADNQTAKDLVAEIFIAERGTSNATDDPPAGAVPWQRATVGSYGIGQCDGILGK
jgi:hypothetical protein